MKEFEDKTIEVLLQNYVVAKAMGAESLCETIWKQMVDYDKEQREKALKELRGELDTFTKRE
jgi:hypothetical protein